MAFYFLLFNKEATAPIMAPTAPEINTDFPGFSCTFLLTL